MDSISGSGLVVALKDNLYQTSPRSIRYTVVPVSPVVKELLPAIGGA